MAYSFRPVNGNDITKHGKVDPTIWSDKVIAVEVETDPTKHKGQVYINYEKNASRGMGVWFVVFSAKHKEYVIDALAEKDIGTELYGLVLVDPQSIDFKNEKYSAASQSVDDMQDMVVKGIGTGYESVQGIVNKSNLTTSQVMACLHSMERRGIVERSGAIQTVTKQSLDLTGTHKTQTKKDTFMLSPDVVAKASPEPNEEKPGMEKYSNTDNVALKLFLDDEDFADYDIVHDVLKSRGYGVRRKKNGGVTLYKMG